MGTERLDRRRKEVVTPAGLYWRSNVAQGKCGQCSHPAEPGKSTCAKHGEYKRILNRRRYRAAHAVSERYNCSLCGGRGHQSRTCEVPALLRPEPQREVRRMYFCSLCGGVGHNARTCAARPVACIPVGTCERSLL